MNVQTLSGHNNPVYAVIAHPHQPILYTAGNDKGVVEWDTTSGQHIRVFKNIKASVYALEIVDNFDLLLAGCNNGELLFFNLSDGSKKTSVELNSAIFSLKFYPEKSELFASTDDGKIWVISVNDGKILYQFSSGNEKIRNIDYSNKLNYLATASNDGSVRIFNLEEFAAIHQFEAHPNGAGALCFSPDGRFLITGGRDAHLRVWNTQNWQCEHNFPAHLFAIYKIAFHPRLPYFATASRDKSIKIWRSEDFSLYRNLALDKGITESHRLSVNQISWSNDGSQLFSVSDDKMVKIWEVFRS